MNAPESINPELVKLASVCAAIAARKRFGDADDLLSDAMLALLKATREIARRRASGDPIGNERGFVVWKVWRAMLTVRNARLRRRRCHPVRVRLSFDPHDRRRDPLSGRIEREEFWAKACAGMTARQVRTFLGHYRDAATYQELAERYGMHFTSIGNRIRNAREIARANLADFATA